MRCTPATNRGSEMAFVRQYSASNVQFVGSRPTPSRFDSTQGVRSSTNIRGPSRNIRDRLFRDRPRMFVDLRASRSSKRAFRGPGGKRPRSFWDPELIRLNSKGCVRSWTVTNVCDRPRMFVDHPRMFLTVHESFVTGPQQKHSWTGPGPTIARDSTVYK